MESVTAVVELGQLLKALVLLLRLDLLNLERNNDATTAQRIGFRYRGRI